MSLLSQPYPLQPYVLNRDTAPAFWALGILWLPLATGVQTGNRLTLLQQEFAVGPGPAAHYHPYDEGFYILEGEFAFQAGGQAFRAGAGTLVHIPRLTQHSFVVEAPARILNFYPSSGFELLLMGMAQPAPERRVPTWVETPLPPHEQLEILFRLFGHVDAPHVAAGPHTAADYVTYPPEWSPASPYHTTAAQSPSYAALGSRWTLLAGGAHTAGTYALFEQRMPAASHTPLHCHAEAEALYILTGTLRLVLDAQVLEAPAGTCAFIPPGTAHSLAVSGEAAACFLNFYLPGGFERGIVELGERLGEAGPANQPPDWADLHAFFEQVGTRQLQPAT